MTALVVPPHVYLLHDDGEYGREHEQEVEGSGEADGGAEVGAHAPRHRRPHQHLGIFRKTH